MPIDNHPSGSILAVNNSIKCVLLPSNTRTPTLYTITLTSTAPVANATSLAYTSITPAPTTDNPLLLEDDLVLTFPTGKKVTVFKNVAGDTVQSITTGAAGTIAVKPIDTPNLPAASAVTTTFGLLELLGVQGMDYANNSNLISIRSQKSGLGNEQRVTSVAYEFSVQGWVHQRSNAYNRVIKDCARLGREMYAEVYLSDGRLISGVFGASNLQNQIQLDQVMQMSFTLFAQGIPTEVLVP